MKKNLFSLRLFLSHQFVLLILCLTLLLGTTARPVQAATYDVDTETDDAALTTCSAAPDDCSLRGAILKTNLDVAADIINLPAGNYVFSDTSLPGEDAADTGDLDITGNLTIIGAGTNVTTINGNSKDRVFESRPATGVTLTINISGVKITGGSLTGLGNVGAAFSDRGTTTGTTILTMTEVVIAGNTHTGNGGSIGLARTFGVSVANSTVNLDRSTISGNVGSGIHCNGCTLYVTNSVITGNSVASATGVGGGINVLGNTADVTLTHTTVSGNTANSNGGGIGRATGTGTITINFSTITNNTSDNDNSSFGDGGGIFSNSGTTTIQNSIVQGNWKGASAPAVNDCAGGAAMTSGGRNVFGSGTVCPIGGTDTTASANLGGLVDNGGPTLSHLPGVGSAAIDWVPNGGTCTAGTTTDQRSVVRGVDPASCDSGAIEADTTPAYKQCSFSTGRNYNMGPGVYLKVNTGTLGCVTVTHYSISHPNATPALQTGKYWNIDGAGATGFNVALTLPDTLTSPVICKYLGVGTDWNCNRNFQVDNGGSVTCNSITSFSDWTVGENPPTAVKLEYFGISQGSGLAGLGLLGAAVAIAMLATALRRRKPTA